MNLKKVQLLNYKSYLLPVFITVGISIGIGAVLITGIRSYFTNQVESEISSKTENYVDMVSKVSEAEKIINEVIDERLISASNIVIENRNYITDERLEQIAKNNLVDKIYWYSPGGEVVASVDGEYKGWKVYKSHPIYKFINSDKEEHVESIRKDSESDKSYKYGYKKASDGYFVQVGIDAENVTKLTGQFNIETLIGEFKNEKNIEDVYFSYEREYGKSNESSAVTGASRDVKSSIDKEIVEFNVDRDSIETFSKDRKTIMVSLPLYISDERAGYLNVVHRVEDVESLIRTASIAGVLALMMISTAAAVTIIHMHKRKSELADLLYYDQLTGLPNQKYLKEFLANKLSEDGEEKKALFLINVIKFKNINLLFGFDNGDKALKNIVERIREYAPEKNKLFRFSDDRFLMYIEDYNAKSSLIDFCSSIIDSFKRDFEIADISKIVNVKIGALELRERYSNPDDVLKDVSIALDNIDHIEGQVYCFFDDSMQSKLKRDEMIEAELRKAISGKFADMLYIVCQPQVDIKTEKTIGFEVLARMKSERLGYLSPVEFIRVAEERQLIIPLGEKIMEKALGFQKTLEDKGYKDIKIAVNLSTIQLMWDYLIPATMSMINKAGVNPSNLEFEVTESIFTDNYKEINKVLEDFKSYGIKIAIDDFGTGYSSLSKIRDLNIDSLKIDKSFTDKITHKEKPIVDDMISLGHRLGLRVVVEGVEHEEQKNHLINTKCDVVQGYLFGKSLSEREAMKTLANI